MNKHCKGCVHHHNAGRINPKPDLEKYNDWCCAKGAKVDIGHCKTMKLKKEANHD